MRLNSRSAARCSRIRIYIPSTRSTFKVLSADARGHHGWRPHGVIIDELQEQRSRDQLEVAKKSMPKRRQPVLILMAHAGTDEESIAFEEYSYAKSVISGTLTDETLLPVIFEAAESDDWQAESTWRKVNPGYGVTVQADAIAQEALEAANEPRKLNDFLRFQLNRWTNQATAWLPLEWWTNCQVKALDLGALAAHEAAGGLDMAQSIDYASFVVVARVPLPPGQAATVAAVTDDTGTATTARSITRLRSVRSTGCPKSGYSSASGKTACRCPCTRAAANCSRRQARRFPPTRCTATSRRRSRRDFRASGRSASIRRSRLTWPSGSARASTCKRFRKISIT